jgi:hypothetical protein
LLDIDFDALGDCPSATRQVWISEMEAAHAAARYDASADAEDLSCYSYNEMRFLFLLIQKIVFGFAACASGV